MSLDWIEFQHTIRVVRPHREGRSRTIRVNPASNHSAPFPGMLHHLAHPNRSDRPIALGGQGNRGPIGRTDPLHQFPHPSMH